MAARTARTAELRAMAHPVRLRILSLLTGAALTAAEIARELGLTHANASYHLRHLLAAGQIEVAGEERIRGGVGQAVPLRRSTGTVDRPARRCRPRRRPQPPGPVRGDGGRTDAARRADLRPRPRSTTT